MGKSLQTYLKIYFTNLKIILSIFFNQHNFHIYLKHNFQIISK